MIESHAVNIIGPDPCDVGGIAELKWIPEYADLHGILMAPHGTGDGPIGVAALVQVCAALPDNYIAFELSEADRGFFDCEAPLLAPHAGTGSRTSTGAVTVRLI